MLLPVVEYIDVSHLNADLLIVFTLVHHRALRLQ